jgi:apolipoprotein N-acyltransferase
LSRFFLKKHSILGSFAIGATLVLLDWFNFTAVPLWGMAQSIVRPWSGYPLLISFVSVTGLTGIIFLLGTLQSLFVNIVFRPEKRKAFILVTMIMLSAFIAVNFIYQSEKATGKIKVTAMGWNDSNNVAYPGEPNSLYAMLVRQASQDNSKIVVSPELGFYNQVADFNEWLLKFQDIAKESKITLVIGTSLQRANVAIIIDPDGSISGRYTKTHLIPFEGFEKGDGQPVIVSIDGTNTGVMICHDDNYTDLSRRYGREKVTLMAVPTFDWAQVKNEHLQSSISRAIESKYAIIRACQNGISAIISPKGEILKKKDHFKEGPGIITAEVPLYSGVTIFSRFGHWPVPLSLIFLLAFILSEMKLKKTKLILNLQI